MAGAGCRGARLARTKDPCLAARVLGGGRELRAGDSPSLVRGSCPRESVPARPVPARPVLARPVLARVRVVRVGRACVACARAALVPPPGSVPAWAPGVAEASPAGEAARSGVSRSGAPAHAQAHPRRAPVGGRGQHRWRHQLRRRSVAAQDLPSRGPRTGRSRFRAGPLPRMPRPAGDESGVGGLRLDVRRVIADPGQMTLKHCCRAGPAGGRGQRRWCHRPQRRPASVQAVSRTGPPASEISFGDAINCGRGPSPRLPCPRAGPAPS